MLVVSLSEFDISEVDGLSSQGKISKNITYEFELLFKTRFFLDNLTIKIIFSNLGKPQEFFPAPNAIHKKNYLNVLPSLLLSITSVTVGFYK